MVATVGQNYNVIVRQHVKPPEWPEDANKDWLVLDGELPPVATGAPICHAGCMAGLVIGISSQNKTQAIAAGPGALRDFVERMFSTKEFSTKEMDDDFTIN